MRIAMVASEAAPFVKTGGLGDVMQALPNALSKLKGNEICLFLPYYKRIKENPAVETEQVGSFSMELAWRESYVGILRLKSRRKKLQVYFIDNDYYFGARSTVYGDFDDGERFAFFCRAVTELLPPLPEKPDVVHCNDWQTALVPIYIRDEAVREEFYKSVRTVITVHNIEYQGRYGRETVEDLFGLDAGWFTGGTLAFDGDVNLLKGAIVTADAVTAVSPTYAQELKYAYFAHGLESVMQMVEGKLHGVLNGIDMERYDPASDPNLTANYSLRRMAGKAKDKAALQRMMGLAERKDTSVVAMVSRLVSHKGLDLVCETLDYFMEKDMQLVVLGKGDGKYESFFSWAQAKYPGRVAVHLGYSESLAMQIYAGADLFLMPSKSEPCGLSQMIAMRYGAVPIVRETGGLKDTVHAYEAWNGAGNGFSFTNYNAGDMCYVIGEAVDLYHQKPEAYKALRKRGMAEDFSWARSAKKYREIYDSICK